MSLDRPQSWAVRFKDTNKGWVGCKMSDESKRYFLEAIRRAVSKSRQAPDTAREDLRELSRELRSRSRPLRRDELEEVKSSLDRAYADINALYDENRRHYERRYDQVESKLNGGPFSHADPFEARRMLMEISRDRKARERPVGPQNHKDLVVRHNNLFNSVNTSIDRVQRAREQERAQLNARRDAEKRERHQQWCQQMREKKRNLDERLRDLKDEIFDLDNRIELNKERGGLYKPGGMEKHRKLVERWQAKLAKHEALCRVYEDLEAKICQNCS
jgi:hypothetical protein